MTRDETIAAFQKAHPWCTDPTIPGDCYDLHQVDGVPWCGECCDWQVDWAGVESVRVLEGGTPCQDVSHAGGRRDVPGISRTDQLKMLGNGVVPQQAAAAVRHLLDLP